jgi:hypothetical protein
MPPPITRENISSPPILEATTTVCKRWNKNIEIDSWVDIIL